ncbi:hypothetical protein JOD31_000232 [Methylopila capsulata]|uniref:Uncharacterized protein n=1 Tax=Methylopila capsulata TaxID=61654 RepID=A0ABS2T2A2_9HYPH|nr:hypothetical protein [Methylopila capsulata]
MPAKPGIHELHVELRPNVVEYPRTSARVTA